MAWWYASRNLKSTLHRLLPIKPVKEEISESTRVEPGVISIYAVAEVDRPNWFHFFEIYASDSAYRSHIESPHFKKYAVTTKSMILSKRLIETTPIELGSRSGR